MHFTREILYSIQINPNLNSFVQISCMVPLLQTEGSLFKLQKKNRIYSI